MLPGTAWHTITALATTDCARQPELQRWRCCSYGKAVSANGSGGDTFCMCRNGRTCSADHAQNTLFCTCPRRASPNGRSLLTLPQM